MKNLILAIALSIVAVPLFAADIGVSISVGDPNFYGHIEIGNTSRPDVIYRDAIIITKHKSSARLEPIYLRVRPGHEKHWGKHCREYNACGRPVYFVRDTWYQKRYASHYHDNGRGHNHKQEARREDRRDDRHERYEENRPHRK